MSEVVRAQRSAVVQASGLSTRYLCVASPTPTVTAPGDLRGLIDKLDYLSWLGIDCLWLPPFYPSPLRDGGYDVSDYTGVLPEFGTVDDFGLLLTAAHQRGIRVIVDFVANHTSDQHPWFQASRSDPSGPYGDYYVWSDDDTRFSDARIIFVDTEPVQLDVRPDPQAVTTGHRFFSHQPDLNFDNPDVQRAIIDALRFWLDKGVDGFRLDRRALPVRPRRNERREPCPRRTSSSSGSARRSTATIPTGSCSARQTSGRPTSSSTSATPSSATSARWRSTSR